MLDYQKMRDTLKAGGAKPSTMRHFTKDFYSTFCKTWEADEWGPVFDTDFYKMDGSGYCLFLEVFNASLPRWRIDFIKYDRDWPIDVGREYIREDTEDAARRYGMLERSRYGADAVEVMRVA